MPGFAVSQSSTLNSEPDMPVGTAPAVPFWDAVERNATDAVRTRNAGVREETTRAELWERHRAAEAASGQKLPLPRTLAVEQGGSQDVIERFSAPIIGGINAAILGRPGMIDDDAYEARLAELKKQYPQAMAGVETREEVMARLQGQWGEIRAQADEAWDTPTGALGAFVGQAAGTMADPRNLGMALATGGAGAGRSLAQRLLAQGGAGAGVEALQVPERIEDAARFGGPEYSPGEAALDIAAGGVGGVVVEGGVAGARAGARALGGRLNPESPGGLAGSPEMPAGQPDGARRRAAQILTQDELDAQALGPLDGPTHADALGALERGQVPRAVAADRDLSQLQAAPGAGATDYRGRPISAASFDPVEIEVDPARFQFKADGDGQGVTARLRGVEAWDPTASGKVIVWEDRGGTRYIADGHQRRALAQRMSEKGWDAQLDGYLFREADGWSAREVRTVAALKNIREGSGSPLDAAKVFRDAPEAINDRSLPVTGEFMAQGRGLARLDNEAFGAVVNKVIPERYAADIGNLAHSRPDLHMGMVRLLKEAEPANGDEARALIVEAMQDDWIRRDGSQEDLFGYDGAQSALIARAKVAANVKRALARDARLYGQLVKNADAIEAGGNALARDANEARLAADRAALELTAKLALRSGPVGEAMAAAAARVAKRENVTTAAKDVLAKVRAAIEAGEDMEAGRGVHIAPEPPSAGALDLARDFDEPAGAGAKAQAEALEVDEPPGLFDDLPEVGVYDRARQAAVTCATGS